MSLKTVTETTLKHTVARDFTQISAAQAPQGACNCVFFDQRLAGSESQCVRRIGACKNCAAAINCETDL
jgi:hypothetical protein